MRIPSGQRVKIRFDSREIDKWLKSHQRVTVEEALSSMPKTPRESSLEFWRKHRETANAVRGLDDH